MAVWIEIRDQDELKRLENYTRVRYTTIDNDLKFGYNDTDDDKRYIRYERDGRVSTVSDEYQDGEEVIGAVRFYVCDYRMVEYLFDSIKNRYKPVIKAVDNRSEFEKNVFDMLLG